MTELLTEQEQVEQLKKWLRLYGIPALLGVIAGIVIFYGWNYYHAYRMRILTHASKVYDEMLTYRAQNNSAATYTQAEKLLKHYSSTPYGDMAALMLAKEAVDHKDFTQAHTQLSWVKDHSHQTALRQIARLRIARLDLAEQKPEAAIDELKKIEDKSFSGLVDEVLGDAYLSQHQVAQAREAYARALKEFPNSEEIRPLLEMKLNNLATAG